MLSRFPCHNVSRNDANHKARKLKREDIMNSIELGSPADVPVNLPSLFDQLEQVAGEKAEGAKNAEASESPVGSSVQGATQPTSAQTESRGHPELEEQPAFQSQGPLTLGQPVFHLAFGYGTIDAIDGEAVTLQLKRDKTVTQAAKVQDLITKNQ